MAFYVQHLSAEKPEGFEILWNSRPYANAEGLQDMVDDLNSLLGDDAHSQGHYRVIEEQGAA